MTRLPLTRRFLLTLLTALALGPLAAASAGPVLLEVDGESVAVADLLPLCPESHQAGEGRERVLLAGLAPGEERTVAGHVVRGWLEEAGVSLPPGCPLTQGLRVRRRAQVVSPTDLVQAGERAVLAALRLEEGDQAAVVVMQPPRPLLAPVGELELEAIASPPRLPGGLWSVQVIVRGGETAGPECALRYRVRVTGEVLVTRRPISRHEALAEEAVAREMRELTALRGEPLRSPSELPGLRAARGAAAGTPLTTEWVEAVPAVRRSEMITVVARVGAVVASTRARALSDGRVGEVIAVRHEGTRNESLVRVVAPGRGEVVSCEG